jgi:hypothetical protein
MRRALCLLGVVAVCWVAAPSSFGTADVQGFMAAIPAVFNARAPAPAMQVGPIYGKQRKSSTITSAKSFDTHNNLEELTTLDWATGAVYRQGNAYATYPTYGAQAGAYTRDGAQPVEAPPQAPPQAPPSGKGVVAHTRIPPIPSWGKMQQNPTKQGKPDHKWAYGNTDWKNAVDYNSIRPKQAGGPRDFTDHTWATGPSGRAISPYI